MNNKFEMTIMKGVIQKQEKQINHLLKKVDDLTTRQMAVNVTISGLPEIEGENCAKTVVKFCEEQMGTTVQENEILAAHRIGHADSNADRLFVVRCTPELKSKLMENKNNLKDKTNAKGKHFYVNTQVPELVAAEKREITHRIRQVKDEKDGKLTGMKTRFKVMNQKLYLNDVPVTKNVLPPSVEELFPEAAEQ